MDDGNDVSPKPMTEEQIKKKAEKEASRQALQDSVNSDLGDLDTDTGSDSIIGRWFAQKNRWTTSLLGLFLNVFANVYVFVVLLNSCGEEYCCPSAFSWNGWTPSETFQLLLGLMLIWVGMVGLGMLWWFATNGFRKGLGGLAIVCGYIMVMGDLFLFMAYLSPSAVDSCVSDAPFYFDVIGSFLPFVLVMMHAWWTISYTELKDIISELRDTQQLYKSDAKAKKARDKARKDKQKARQGEIRNIVGSRLVFKPFSVLRTVIRPTADPHQHPL